MTGELTVAFILVSYARDAPAGMERATAALAEGVRGLGHRALLVTATPSAEPDTAVLETIKIPRPASDDDLRAAIDGHEHAVADELRALFHHHRVDVAVYVDALWGLGRLAPRCPGVLSVLAMHVVGHDQDLVPALERADLVIAPSSVVLDQAHDRGYDPSCWKVVRNALLHDAHPADEHAREELRRTAPVRVLARLGPEKNVHALLEAGRLVERPVEVVLAEAGFEHEPGGQAAEYQRCAHAAAHLPLGGIRTGGLPWHRVQPWLAGAAVVIVPSTKESFGLVALEAMSVGTPVVAFDVDNLPALVGTGDQAGGVIVPVGGGEFELWRVAEALLDDPLRYAALSRAAYYRSRDYLPTTVAQDFIKAVR